MMKKIFMAGLLILGLNNVQAQVHDTINIHFPLNDPKVSKEASAYIDSLIFHDVLIHWQKLTVLGYTDYLGSKAYNEVLSKERARNVKNYLVDMGMDSNDIKLCMGKGKIDHAPINGKEGIASDRKVQIIIDADQTRSAAAVAPAAAKVMPAKTIAAKPAAAVAPAKTTKIDLTSIKINQAINLKNLLFEGDMHILLPESTPELENLYRLMKENNMVRIQIEGHICCMDPSDGKDKKDADNSGWLSETRALAIYDYLVEKGIDPGRIKHKGFGNTRPLVYPEKTDEERRLNRRVEIRILGK